jgi:hypothetical protein
VQLINLNKWDLYSNEEDIELEPVDIINLRDALKILSLPEFSVVRVI